MTPNLGAGGNAAIESAAALANSLTALSQSTKTGQPPSLEVVRKFLRAYYEKRHLRANIICDSANDLVCTKTKYPLGNFGWADLFC